MLFREAAIAFAICLAMAALEGVMAGGGVKARLASLRAPPGSPALPVWIAIGGLYYVMCFFVLYRLLERGLSSPLAQSAFVLLLAIMIYNAAWNWLFFRRASFLAFIPYALLMAGLVVCLARMDVWSAAALGPYLAYLIYATWWSHSLWRMNA